MISKVSKSLVAALLLAVNFNTSYGMDNNNYPMGEIINLVGQYNSAYNNRQMTVTRIMNWMNFMPQIRQNYPIQNDLNLLQNFDQQLIDTNANITAQMNTLYNNLFANNYRNILSLFTDWDINQLNTLNNVLNLQPVKQYIAQGRIAFRLNNEINGIQQNLINRIIQNGINQDQIFNEYLTLVNNIFRPYFERIQMFYNTINNNFVILNNEGQRIDIVNRIRNTLKQSFHQRYQYIYQQHFNIIRNDYYHNIINNVLVQNALAQNNGIHANNNNINIANQNNIANHANNNNNDVFHQILDNIQNNIEVEQNIKNFFNNNVGDSYNKIFSTICNENNNQVINDIYSILQDNRVKEYLAIGSIKNKLESDIHEVHKQFFNSFNDPSENNDAASAEVFKTKYLDFMKNTIKMRTDKINDESSGIRYYINLINTNNNPIKQNIKNLLNKFVNNREQYLNSILQNITNNLNNIYQDYVEYYGVLHDENDNNINRENDKQNIIRRNMPVLP